MSDRLSLSEQQRRVRQRRTPGELHLLGELQPSPQPDVSPPRTRAAASSAPIVSPTPHSQAADAVNEAKDAEEEAEVLPVWKAKLKEAVTVDTDTNEKVSVWAEKMFIGDGAAMKGVLEHLKSISFTLNGKTAYTISEAENESVTNLEKGWKQILGKLADDYAYSVYIKDRRIYFLQNRHEAEFEQVRTGVIAKGKDGARNVFARLQTEDLEEMAEQFNSLPEDGRKITDPQQQTTAIAKLRGELEWTRLTVEEVKALQAWFKAGEVTGRKGVGGDTDKLKKLSFKEAVTSIAERLNEHYELNEEEQFTTDDLRDPDQIKLLTKLTGPQPDNDDSDDDDHTNDYTGVGE